MLTGEETQASISAWATETFSNSGSDLSVVTRACLEMAELCHGLAADEPMDKIAGEIADVVIVSCRLADRLGTTLSSPDDLHIAASGHKHRNMFSITAFAGMLRLASFFAMDEAAYARLHGHEVATFHRMMCEIIDLANFLEIDISAEVDKKMKINRARKWNVFNGHGQHVEGT